MALKWPRPWKASVRSPWPTSSFRCFLLVIETSKFFFFRFEISKFSALANVKIFPLETGNLQILFVYTEELKLLGLFQSEHARTVPLHRTVTV
jgi:hypothetical protein